MDGFKNLKKADDELDRPGEHQESLLGPGADYKQPVAAMHNGILGKLSNALDGDHDRHVTTSPSQPIPTKHENIFDQFTGHNRTSAPLPAVPPVTQHGILEKIGSVHEHPAVAPFLPPPPQPERILEKLELDHRAPPPPPRAVPQHESVLEKLGLEHHPPSPPPSTAPSAPNHEEFFEKLGLENHTAPVPTAAPVVPQHENLFEKLGVEHRHSPSAPPPPPKHDEGLLEKIGLAAPPSQVVEPAGILGQHRHDVPLPPTERLMDRVDALGHGVLAGRAHPPKEEHGVVHKLSGVFNSEEGVGMSGLVRKINGDHRPEEKKEGVFDKAADFVHEHVHVDESTSEKIADAVKREYQKVEHSLENYYE
ncbi:hypothetical protein C8R45DRAFT_975412 [Mycena sanguinolenta]|nr:hypothetical protein C8R45DRAFT_975412 [Mycena sanguinolenta]